MNGSLKKFSRIPASISGRAYSNGILLRGGKAVVISVRNSEDNIVTEKFPVKIISGYKIKPRAFRESIMVFSDAFLGIKYSLKAFKINKHFSIPRLLKNHGAEHKIIHCYENGEELTLENAKKQPTYHPRCGTGIAANTLLTEVAFCILVPGKIRNAFSGLPDIALMLAALCIGFKSSRYSAKHTGKIARALAFPGKMAQKLTALEPNDGMLECGLEAAKKVLERENVI